MKNELIVKTLKEAIKNKELFLTKIISEAIYYHSEVGLIDGDFDCGSRGLDHNTLLYNGITFSDLMSNGVLLVPELNVYISNEEIDIFNELERLPLDDNHFVGYKLYK